MPVLKAQPTRNKAKSTGVAAYLYLAPLDEFLAIQKPLPTGTGSVVGDEATISANHTFKSGTPARGFIKIPLAGTNNGKFDVKTEGDYPSEKIVSSFEVRTVGLSAEQIEMIKRLRGQNLLALQEDADCDNGKVYQLGCECKPIDSLKVEYSTDDNVLKLSGKAECLPSVYTGTITLMA